MKALIAALMFVFASGAWAQGKPLACQVDAAGGLKWENGQWNVRSFVLKKFILVMEGGKLTDDSLNKATNLPSFFWSCEVLTSEKRNLCRSSTGAIVVYYSPLTNKGAISSLHGAIDDDLASRDTVVVQAFTCQPF